ncbi:hypothetical protein GpartN1_g340.t1 [Galdieria partita]|uniref:DUF1995 domain-containing protein n=1 Tax=Galdieria partita TaxID=83374 RepID=A0A9C7PQ96_9RHOD|nr:hypothetical protein GpartN1_g340.t1 [Galdieria partita]
MFQRTKVISLFTPLSLELRLCSSCFQPKLKRISTCLKLTWRSIFARSRSFKAQIVKSNFDGEEMSPSPNQNLQQSLESYIAGTLFPFSLEDAVRQASDAVLSSVKDNYRRLRVELHYPTLSSLGSVIEYSELAYFCNMICETFLGQSKRVHLFGDTHHVLNLVPFLDTRLINSISVSCIDDMDLGVRDMLEEICLILLPSNTGYDTGTRMERIERLIYSVPYNKHIILFNPSMEACTNLTCSGRPFEPMILSDFHIAYFVHPNISRQGCIQSSLLRCYPRDWELFVLRLPRDIRSKYFLAKSFPSRPSMERIETEVSCYFYSL